MTFKVGNINMMSTEFGVDEFARVRAVLQEVIKKPDGHGKMYAVFEYNADNGIYSRSTHSGIENLMHNDLNYVIAQAKAVSLTDTVMYAVIQLRAHQTAPNTLVYDQSDKIHAIVLKGKAYNSEKV